MLHHNPLQHMYKKNASIPSLLHLHKDTVQNQASLWGALAQVMETSNGSVEVVGLAKVPCASAAELEGCLAEANGLRTTSKTDANDTSSRSHSISQVTLHPPGDANAEQPLVRRKGLRCAREK
jgi:hypothetical protein